MKKIIFTVFLIVMFLAGLSLLLYPTVSNYLNELHSSRVISDYVEQVKKVDADLYKEIWNAASDYNQSLLEQGGPHTLTQEEREEYEAQLKVSDVGIIGYIEIPSMNFSIPIYHGTKESVLQIAVGHMEGSSLPVGGTSTHCVLSGHRGLPSAKLFSDLDKMSVGDIFILRVLDEELTYEVDQILTVEPSDMQKLQIVKGEDYCTLVTCTPYGINTHRLLVRGHRIENQEQEDENKIHITPNAMLIDPLIVASIGAVSVLFALLITLLVKTSRENKKKQGE